MKRRVVFGMILIALFAMLPTMGRANPLGGTSPPEKRSAGPALPLTLKQAWQLALREARGRWSSHAVMAEIISVDTGGDTVRSGRDGRRRSWLATVVAPNKLGMQLNERIIDGVVVEARSEPVVTIAPAMRHLPKIDSEVAIRTATRARPDIGPDRSREHGYGFIAHIDTHGRMIIAVMGSYRDQPAQVDIAAGSGRVLGASIYTVPTTVLYSADGGQRWSKSNLRGGFIAGITAVPGSPGVAYAIETGIWAIRLWKTSDGGRSWAIASVLPQRAATNAHGLAVERMPDHGTIVAVGSNAGLWFWAAGRTSWQHGTGLPAGVVQWLAPGWLGWARALLVSVVTGTGQGGVYASTDLHVWRKVVSEADRLSVSVNGAATIALSEDNPGTAYRNARGEVARRIILPIPALSVAGQFGTNGVELAGAPDRVIRSTDGGLHWTTTLDQQRAQQPLDEVTVGPGFPTDGVALVGGFNGGLFRSTDTGQTWREVQTFPTTPADEIGPLVFVQASQVVAASTGPGEWWPFY